MSSWEESPTSSSIDEERPQTRTRGIRWTPPRFFLYILLMCERAGPSYQPPRPSRLPEQTPSEIQNRNITQYQNSASIEELAKSPHGLQRKPATSRLIFADVWQPNRKGWRKYHSSLQIYFFFLKIFGAQGTAPSSLDSFTQLVTNSSNFYARFRKRFRPSIWPCLVFS